MVKPLNNEGFLTAVDYLSNHDPILAGAVKKCGIPRLLDRPTGFPTLVYTILEQQVSLVSAKATFGKLNAKLPNLTPDALLSLSNEDFLAIGFSRQKARYCILLAKAISDGSLDLSELNSKSDADVFSILTSLKGIGPWTANIYLLSALKRPDIWPAGDLALQVAIQEMYSLDRKPSTEELSSFGDKWKPYRAVAARILWQYYRSRSA